MSVRAALGIQPETEKMLQLQDRVDWLAHELRRDVRTARRRVDEACGRLAEVLDAGSPARARRRGPGWYVTDFYALALLDRPDPLTIERREIVADRDGLDEIALAFSLRDTGSPTDLNLRVLYGGQLAEPRRRPAAGCGSSPAAPAAAAGRAARVLGDGHAAADAGDAAALRVHAGDPVRPVPPAGAVRPGARAGADLAGRRRVPPRPGRAVLDGERCTRTPAAT